MKIIFILISNELLEKIAVNTVVIFVMLGILSVIKGINERNKFKKREKSDIGTLEKKLRENSQKSEKMSSLENVLTLEQINSNKRKIEKEREEIKLNYHLKNNNKYRGLEIAYKNNILNEKEFTISVAKLKEEIRDRDVLNKVDIQLLDGTEIKVLKENKINFLGSKVLAEKAILKKKLIETEKMIYQLNNDEIINEYYKKEYTNLCNGKKFIVKQKSLKIARNDEIINYPIHISNGLYKVENRRGIMIEDMKIKIPYWRSKTFSVFNDDIEIWQKLKNEIQLGDLMFINGETAPNKLYFILSLFKLLKTKEGKIIYIL